MKLTHLLFAVLVLAVVAFQVDAQPKPEGLSVKKIASSKAYAVDQIDTSNAYPIAGASMISAYLYYADSCVVWRYIDYSANGTSWTKVAGDTVTATAAGTTELVYRSGNSEASTGVFGWIRTRHAFQAACGVTTATYRNWLYYKP